MKNLFIKTSLNKIDSVKSELIKKNAYLVEIDGRQIKTIQEYLKVVSEKFNFPEEPSHVKWDGYLDWIRDLSWLENYSSFAIIIYNYENFLSKDEKKKKAIIEDFVDVIIPYWENKIIEVTKGGKPKAFSVYIL